MKKEYHCKYCGTKAVPKYGTICASCSVKRNLIRKIQKMIRDTAEVGRKEQKQWLSF